MGMMNDTRMNSSSGSTSPNALSFRVRSTRCSFRFSGMPSEVRTTSAVAMAVMAGRKSEEGQGAPPPRGQLLVEPSVEALAQLFALVGPELWVCDQDRFHVLGRGW